MMMGLFANPMRELAAWNNAQILLLGFCNCFMSPFKQSRCQSLEAPRTLENAGKYRGTFLSLRVGISQVRQFVPGMDRRLTGKD